MRLRSGVGGVIGDAPAFRAMNTAFLAGFLAKK